MALVYKYRKWSKAVRRYEERIIEPSKKAIISVAPS